jgi:methionine synthase I (cobalamin-dependent)
LEDWDGEWGSYPNLGVTDFENDYFGIIDDHKFEESMRSILNKNPDVIGTCCGSSPRHVNMLNDFIER